MSSAEVTPVREVITRLAVLKVLRDRVNAAFEQARHEAAGMLADGDRITATVDGQRLGSVTAVAGSLRARVVDDLAFTAWVRKRYPLELVTGVRESFKEAFLRRLAADAEPGDTPADPATGERVAGVEFATGSGYLRVTPVKDAPTVLGQRPAAVRAALGAVLENGTGQ